MHDLVCISDLPINVNDKLNKIKKYQRQLTQKVGRVPTRLELATELGWEVENLAFLIQSFRKTTSLDTLMGRMKILPYWIPCHLT